MAKPTVPAAFWYRWDIWEKGRRGYAKRRTGVTMSHGDGGGGQVEKVEDKLFVRRNGLEGHKNNGVKEVYFAGTRGSTEVRRRVSERFTLPEAGK